jgi:hypothetical protein
MCRVLAKLFLVESKYFLQVRPLLSTENVHPDTISQIISQISVVTYGSQNACIQIGRRS